MKAILMVVMSFACAVTMSSEQKLPLKGILKKTSKYDKDWFEKAGDFCCDEDCRCCGSIGCLSCPPLTALGAMAGDCMQAWLCSEKDKNCESTKPSVIGGAVAAAVSLLTVCSLGTYSQWKKFKRAKEAQD